MNDLTFPEKPAIPEAAKLFLRACLSKPGSRLDLG